MSLLFEDNLLSIICKGFDLVVIVFSISWQVVGYHDYGIQSPKENSALKEQKKPDYTDYISGLAGCAFI